MLHLDQAYVDTANNKKTISTQKSWPSRGKGTASDLIASSPQPKGSMPAAKDSQRFHRTQKTYHGSWPDDASHRAYQSFRTYNRKNWPPRATQTKEKTNSIDNAPTVFDIHVSSGTDVLPWHVCHWRHMSFTPSRQACFRYCCPMQNEYVVI